MRRLALLAFSLSWVFIVLVAFAPLAEATVLIPHQSTLAQLDTGGNIFNQIDSLYNNFTKRLEDINPLASQQAVAPSVKIAAVKTATGQAVAPQVIVTLENGKVALDAVRVDVAYKNAAGVNATSNSAVVALKVDETRSITFTPTSLPAGSYAIGVVVYKNGTDPSNQSTPPYATQQNAATLTIASPTSTSAAAGKQGDFGSQANNAGDVLTQLNTWVYFVIAITTLITIALFFVFSQNRSGEDRYEEDHFRREGYPAGGGGVFDPPTLSESPSAGYSHDNAFDAASARRPSRRIEVDASEWAREEPGKTNTKTSPHSTEDVPQFDADGFVVGDVTSKKALRSKIRGKRGA